MSGRVLLAGFGLAMLAGCAPPAEDNIIIDFEASRFAQWEVEPLIAHVEQLWWIDIQEGPGAPWFGDPEFYVPDARRVLQNVAERCQLGEVIFQHQNHGMASIVIDDLELSSEKVACMRRFERRGISVRPPIGIRALEELRAKGILPSADVQN